MGLRTLKALNLSIILVFSLASGVFAQAAKETLTGEVRDLATDKLLFNFLSETEKNGETWSFKSTYTYPDGKVAVVETGSVKGAMVQSYNVDQQQTGEKAEINISGDKVLFSMTTPKGKKESAKEKLDPRFVVGPTLTTRLRLPENWSKLIKGEKIKVRFGVWNRKETVGFRFFKKRDYEENGRKLMDVVMNPTSWFIRQLVDDLVMTFDVEEQRMTRIKGRVSPKKKDGDKWADLDAVTYYKRPEKTKGDDSKSVETQVDLGDE